MELIPVLSTIILVATITTFILAVGAYILYKVRERRGLPVNAMPESAVEAELVTPSGRLHNDEQKETVSRKRVEKTTIGKNIVYSGRLEKPEKRLVIREQLKVTTEKPAPEKFTKYSSAGYVSSREDKDSGALKWR